MSKGALADFCGSLIVVGLSQVAVVRHLALLAVRPSLWHDLSHAQTKSLYDGIASRLRPLRRAKGLFR